MKTRLTFVALGLTLFAGAAQAQERSIAVGPRPESITKGWDGKFYVSIQGPSGALGTFDGEVRQLDIDTGVVTPFVAGLENPRGITFTGKYLVVADQVKIFRIDRQGNVVLLAAAPQFPFTANFFNDVAAEEGGKAVYVAEMGRRDIIRVPPPPPQVLIPSTATPPTRSRPPPASTASPWMGTSATRSSPHASCWSSTGSRRSRSATSCW